MYAPGVPRVNGRYDLGELDQQREEMNIRSGGFDRINWPKQLIWVIGFSLVMAVVAIIVVWLTRLGLVSSNSGERIESTAAAPLALFMLLTAAWMLPFADTDLVADNLSPRWLPATGYVCLISIIHAAVLTLTSMLWPLIVGGAGFGSRIQDWPITPARLGLIFLICWAVGLSSTGSLMSLQRLMFTRLWMLFAVGIPWALLTVGGVIVLAYVLVNSAPANYGAVTVVVAVALLVAHILVPTVLLASQPRRR